MYEQKPALISLHAELQQVRDLDFYLRKPGIYPPTQKATPACRNPLRRADTGLCTVDECEEGTPRSSHGA